MFGNQPLCRTKVLCVKENFQNLNTCYYEMFRKVNLGIEETSKELNDQDHLVLGEMRHVFEEVTTRHLETSTKVWQRL